MANKPFDQRIINHLERPTSRDLNTAQSQLNLGARAMMRQLLMRTTDFPAPGSIGASFLVEKTTGDRNFKIGRGVGFINYGFNSSTDLDIDGITGLSDPFDYRLVTLQSDEGVPVEVPLLDGIDLCRRDVIAIRCSSPTDAQVQDYVDTDIYDPGLNKFNAVQRPKTFTYDLTGEVPQVVNYDAVSGVTARVVYITGQVSPYSSPDSFLSAPITIAPTGYLNIAVVNVRAGVPSVAQSDVVDYRRLVSPQGNLVVSGSATIGAEYELPGKVLSDVALKAPPGIQVQIMKQGNGSANSYLLAVYGPRSVTSASVAFSTSEISAVYDDLSIGGGIPLSYIVRPTQIVQGPIALNNSVTSAIKAYAASAQASPPLQVAIGQPYHLFPFTLCRVDNAVSTETKPVTISGDVSINPLVIPNSDPAAWPAGTYTASGGTVNRTYYMNYGTGPTAPIDNIPSPVYQLGITSASAETSSVHTYSNTYSRVAGFLLPFDTFWQTFPDGVWKFSIYTRFQSGYGNAYLKAVAYIYDGVNDPEAGTAVGIVEDVVVSSVPRSAAYDTVQRVDFYMRVNTTAFTSGRRPYVALYQKWDTGSPAPGDQLTIYYGGDNPAVVETNIVNNIQTTVPNLAERYPAGTYPLSGSFSADPFNLQIDVPGALQVLNPKADSFAYRVADVRTVPITFTVNLTLE